MCVRTARGNILNPAQMDDIAAMTLAQPITFGVLKAIDLFTSPGLGKYGGSQ